MKKGKIRSTWSHIMLAVLLGSQLAFAVQQEPPKIKPDDIYLTVAGYLATQSEASAASIANTLADVIEVGEIKISDKDGKATAMVKERAPSNTVSVNKTIRLIFAPEGDKWKWESFENDRDFIRLTNFSRTPKTKQTAGGKPRKRNGRPCSTP